MNIPWSIELTLVFLVGPKLLGGPQPPQPAFREEVSVTAVSTVLRVEGGTPSHALNPGDVTVLVAGQPVVVLGVERLLEPPVA
ncbi:hypothetical protein, partial [Thermogutta sp.]|uniref:hypothetical protein n=1 Tax=Thermogutta sp. TaxID=1962930 RepID=UPI0032203284